MLDFLNVPWWRTMNVLVKYISFCQWPTLIFSLIFYRLSSCNRNLCPSFILCRFVLLELTGPTADPTIERDAVLVLCFYAISHNLYWRVSLFSWHIVFSKSNYRFSHLLSPTFFPWTLKLNGTKTLVIKWWDDRSRLETNQLGFFRFLKFSDELKEFLNNISKKNQTLKNAGTCESTHVWSLQYQQNQNLSTI